MFFAGDSSVWKKALPMQGISQGLEYGPSALATARLGGFKAEGKVLDTGRPSSTCMVRKQIIL